MMGGRRAGRSSSSHNAQAQNLQLPDPVSCFASVGPVGNAATALTSSRAEMNEKLCTSLGGP